MPLNANEEALIGRPSVANLEDDHQRVDYAPEEDKKAGKWTLIAFILNRTIGSGIFLTPHRVLAGTGCVGGALCVWVLGALISLCGLYVWLECGLSMPQRVVRGESEARGVPRSGGEKNYLEFMFPNRSARIPHIRTTCMFAILFILMYNLSGNAISFGLQVLTASGHYDKTSGTVPPRATVIAIGIAALTGVILLHSISRKGGILVNNIFAILKVVLLLTIFCLGVATAAGRFGGSGDVIRNNFNRDAFRTERADVPSWSNSLLLCMYAFSGYEQPFYILAEIKSPRKNFPKYTVLAMIIATVLFLLVNISFLLVVDKSEILPSTPGGIPSSIDMATLFFDKLWGDDHQSAARSMAALIAVAIFGNLWVMTFTASRIKQEIAKEGILPFSLILATAYRTPYGMWQKWRNKHLADDQVEHAPQAAFAFHWLTSVFLIAITAPIYDPRKTYSALISLYSYTVILMLGFWVSIGLIRTKLQKSKWHWQERRRYRPWLSPVHVIIYALATGFMLVAAFAPPERGSPYHQSVTGFPYFIIPTIGITAPFWGLLYYCGFRFYESKIKGRELVVSRSAYWTPDPDCPGEYVQLAEIIDHTWEVPARDDMSDEFEKPQAGLYVNKTFVTRTRPANEDLEEARASEPYQGGRRVQGGDGRDLDDGFD